MQELEASASIQRGVLRSQGNGPDIGAFEALPFQITVTTLEDENDGDLNLDDISLREAILFSSSGATINFASSLLDADSGKGTIQLDLGKLVINKDLTINGLGADKLTISGQNTSQVFRVDNGQDDSQITVEITGLTIADGRANGGGGIYNNQEVLTIRDSVISGNEAFGMGGGGIFSAPSSSDVSSTIHLIDSVLRQQYDHW